MKLNSDHYNKQENYAIFHIDGNPEKDLIGTCVINSYHQIKPEKKIIIVTNFPDIWLHNPDVYRIYKLGLTSYFHEDFIENKNSEIYAHDPYLTSDFINNKKSLAEIWCNLIKIPYNNSKPKLYFTQREEEVARRLTQKNKPILLIQGNEIFPHLPKLVFDWTKDLPIYILQKVANKAIEKGYDVIQIINQGQPTIVGAQILSLNLRLSLAMLKNVSKVLAINSYLQHACVAMNKSAVITWLSSSPKTNGYEMHTNIIGTITDNIKDKLDSYSSIFDIKAEIVSQPVIMEEIYNEEEIIKALNL